MKNLICIFCLVFPSHFLMGQLLTSMNEIIFNSDTLTCMGSIEVERVEKIV